MKRRLVLALLCLVIGCIAPQQAAASGEARPCQPASSQLADLRSELATHAQNAGTRRVAIVLGNGAYSQSVNGIDPLMNAAADARLVADASSYAGYYTLCFLDLRATQIAEIAKFVRDNPPGGQLRPRSNDLHHLFFYFAGHGFSHNGATYLLPSDYSTIDPIASAVNVETLLNELRQNGDFVIAVIDACRAAPPRLATSSAHGSQIALTDGPATKDVPGLLIQYSSANGHLASDIGRLAGQGPFAPNFAHAAEIPGVPFLSMLGAAQALTRRQTGQVPDIRAGRDPSDRLFHPHDGTLPYQVFAMAWSTTNLHASPCNSAQASLLLMRQARINSTDQRLIRNWQRLFAQLELCEQQRSYAAAIIEPTQRGSPVALNTHTSVIRVRGDDTFVWSEALNRNSDALTVSALRPGQASLVGDVGDPSTFRVADNAFQQVISANNLLAGARVFQERQSGTASVVAFAQEPLSAEQALVLLRTQVALDAQSLAHRVPLVSIQIIERDSAFARVVGGSANVVLVNQTALRQAVAAQ